MTIRIAATAAWAALLCGAVPARAAAPVTLDDAFRRAVAHHPELRQFDTRRALLSAERERAALRPELEAGVQLENALGTGTHEGIREAELTFHLGSILERGGKAGLRQSVVRRQVEALQSDLDARTLDLLAEVARRFVALGAAEHLLRIASENQDQRGRGVQMARARLEAGASPESTVLAAEVALAQANLTRLRADQQRRSARQHLAALWAERDPDFTIPIDGLLTLPTIDPIESLAAALQRSPELSRIHSEQRVREARLRLARSSSVPDLKWQVGVRRLEADNDFALVAGLSMPLGSRTRNEPQVRAAAVELTGLELEHEATEIALYSTLAEAHGRYQVARLEVQELQDAILPRLARAEAAAARAYLAGAASFMELAQLQAEHAASRARQVEAAAQAHVALIEIQRLTGHSFLTVPATATGENP